MAHMGKVEDAMGKVLRAQKLAVLCPVSLGLGFRV